MPENTQANTLKRSQLIEVIRETIGSDLTGLVDAAVEPLKAQQTKYFESIQSASQRRNFDKKSDGGIGAARMVRALAAAKGDPVRAQRFAEQAANQVWKDDLGEAVIKALQAGDFTGGGFIIPPEFAQGIIEYLYNRSIVRRAGARVLPMPNGTLTMPKHTTSVTATYVGEDQNIPTTEPAGGQLVLTAKKLTAMVPVSNDLLRFDAGDAADRWVRDDLVSRIAVREDSAFIRDDGLEHTPKGLRNWAASANVSASNGTTAAQKEQDFEDLVNALEQSNVDTENDTVIFMNPRTKNDLRIVRDAAGGNLVFPELRDSSANIYGIPVFVSNNIPSNLGAGTDAEIYLVNMSHVIIGEAMGLQIEVDSSASYHSGSTVVSAFERDETLIRAITQHDLAVRHAEAIAVKTGVAY